MFICNNDQRSYKINHSFDCNEKCLIYLLTSNCYHKQYVRQTVDIFRNKWNNYKNNVRKFDRGEHCMQRHFYEHFILPGHSGFLQDVSITLIDKTDTSFPTTLKTKAPMGLNYWLIFLHFCNWILTALFYDLPRILDWRRIYVFKFRDRFYSSLLLHSCCYFCFLCHVFHIAFFSLLLLVVFFYSIIFQCCTY